MAEVLRRWKGGETTFVGTRQREWEKKERWVGVNWDRRELISILGDVHVRGTFEVVFLLFLTAPASLHQRKPSTSPRSSRIEATVKELKFDFGTELGLE